jgi:hypothetical protein
MIPSITAILASTRRTLLISSAYQGLIHVANTCLQQQHWKGIEFARMAAVICNSKRQVVFEKVDYL